jgi:Calcineurin-like phosphoesterase
MRLTIVHLSDIHIRSVNDPVLARARAISSALSSLDFRPEAVLFAVSGDIAFSGKSEEYQMALLFLKELEQHLREFNADVELAFATVPGNHDCYLPEAGAALRRALVEGIKPTVNKNQPDAEILIELLKAQSAYFDFQGECTSRQAPDQRLCSSELISLKGLKIQLNLYNTALMSERNEEQGGLSVPNLVFERLVGPAEGSPLSIALFHHSYSWLESNNMIEFRRHVEDNADIVLTGHQHFDHGYVKQNLVGERVLYLEGAALQDPAFPQVSEFNVVETDVDRRMQRVAHLAWKNDRGWGVQYLTHNFKSVFRRKSLFAANASLTAKRLPTGCAFRG